MARQAREARINVASSSIIDYPEAWNDPSSGPFGNAYAWALQNMAPNTEVVGVRIEHNRFERADLFKFRLLRGEGTDVRGKMDTSEQRHYTIKSGYMGLVEAADRWIKRWILVEDQGEYSWHLDWEVVKQFHPYPQTPPAMAHSLMGQLANLTDRHSNSLNRSWIREVAGMPFRALRGSHREYLVAGESTPAQQMLYGEVLDLLAGRVTDVGDRPWVPGRVVGELSHDQMTDLVNLSRAALNIQGSVS